MSVISEAKNKVGYQVSVENVDNLKSCVLCMYLNEKCDYTGFVVANHGHCRHFKHGDVLANQYTYFERFLPLVEKHKKRLRKALNLEDWENIPNKLIEWTNVYRARHLKWEREQPF